MNKMVPRYRRRFDAKKVAAYMFLPPDAPYCNSNCTGCYILSSESFRNRVQRSEKRIIEDLRGLRTQGFSLFAITTEILLFQRYLEMLRLVDSDCVMTNGKVLLQRSERLEEMRGIGIKQIVITGNFDNSGLRLTEPEMIYDSIELVKNSGMELMVRITITSENLEKIPNMIKELAEKGVRTIQFLRYIPLDKKVDTIDEQETIRFFEILEQMRREYPKIYLSAGGNFGTKFRKKKFSCEAGKNYVTVGVNDRVYPCIYITQDRNAIGRFENGKIKIERKNEIPGNKFDCPAYRNLRGEKYES